MELHHLALPVKNAAAAATFYREALGLDSFDRGSRGTGFRLGPVELHLVERPGAHTADHHFAVLTGQFEEVVARVPSYGGRVEEARPIDGMGRRCFVYDPDGNKIELLDRP